MKGFTLVELLVAIGIATILLGMTTISLVKVQTNTTLGGAIDSLTADLKSQQIKSMSGSSEAGSFGIHFTSTNSYVLFKSPYVEGNSANFTINLDEPIRVSSAFPGNEIIFSQIKGGTGSTNTITIQNTAGGQQQTMTINSLGVITDVN